MPPRLLVADDSITIQKVIELTFADEKIEVVAVSDGEQAIRRLVSEPFDIVLADVGMPVKDGFEVAAFVKGHAALGHLPVILLTGAFEPVDDAKASAAGAAAVLAKPFEPQVLVARVRDLLRSVKTAARPVTTLQAQDAPTTGSIARPAIESASSSVDEYFERLDRAFANLNAPLEPREPVRSFPRPVPPRDTRTEEPEIMAQASADEVSIEAEPKFLAAEMSGEAETRGGAEPSRGAEALPLQQEAPPPQEEAPPPRQIDSSPLDAPATSSLANRFATLLAVEQGELPVTALDPAPATIDDALVDRVVRRVVEQLSDRAVRDLAADIVSRTAERLVREEIDRIKSGT